MRTCKRCNCEMLEGYRLKGNSFSTGVSKILLADGPGYYDKDYGMIKVAVCPKCGELNLYYEDIRLLKQNRR